MGFETLLKLIRGGRDFDQMALLPYLCYESSEERGRVNFQLAEAFAQAGNYKQAKVFIGRAWLFSGFSEEVFDLYKLICERNDDIDSLREAYKRQGMRHAREGRIEQALAAFNQWQYALAAHYHLDKYTYDTDVLECVESLAQPFKFNEYQVSNHSVGQNKLRLAYLVYGAAHANSVLVKINQVFAKYHDKCVFDVAFFIPDSNLSRKQIQECENNFKSCGVEVFFAPKHCKEQRLVSFAGQIHEFQPDILITSAALAEFEHYFIALLRPAPLVIGLLQGPPQQFTAQGLDYAISWSRHPLIDSPVDTSFVKLGITLPDPAAVPRISRDAIGIPDDAIVLMSAGRYVKFQDADFWKNLVVLMNAYPDIYYVAVGVERSQIPSLMDFDINSIEKRMRFLGWRKDCVSLLTIADIVIDTYPSGGGHVLVDAMALGVPFVSFANNYLHAFDQTDWSVAEEFVTMPELIVPRGDFQRFAEVVGRLISDNSYRKEMSDKCARQIRLEMPTEEAGVRALEREYIRLSKAGPIRTQGALHSSSIKVQQTFSLKKLIKNYLAR